MSTRWSLGNMAKNESSIDKKLEKELNDCPEGGIFLIETSAENILEVHLAAVKWLSDKKYVLIILSTSRPCKNLLNLYQKNNIDTNKIVIVCTVCQEKEKDKQENGRV